MSCSTVTKSTINLPRQQQQETSPGYNLPKRAAAATREHTTHDSSLGMDAKVVSQTHKSPVDAQSLQDLLARPGIVTRSLKETDRKAEGVTVANGVEVMMMMMMMMMMMVVVGVSRLCYTLFFFFFSIWAPLHTQEGDTLSLNYTSCFGVPLGLSPSHWTPTPDRRLGRNPRGGTLIAQVAKGPRGDMPTSALLHTGGTGKGSRDQPFKPHILLSLPT